MKKIGEIKQEQQERLSSIFKQHGIFFAFSQKQFDEQKKEGVNYVARSGGMLIPKENVYAFYAAFEVFSEECEKELREQIPMDDYIYDQLANYESWYTGKISTAFEQVKLAYPDCTEADMMRVYRSHNGEI